eukprot:jgi/Tetstr1/454146/TSEL_041065.t1
MVVMIVNATRIESIRNDMKAPADKTVIPETESMLIRSSSGERIPKKAYWLRVHPDTDPESAAEILSIEAGDGSRDTDAQAFTADVASDRVNFVYRADQRIVFSIEPSGNKFLVRPSSGSSSVRLCPKGMSGPRKMTFIGLPESLVTTSVAGGTT